jgi:hypothetical protein
MKKVEARKKVLIFDFSNEKLKASIDEKKKFGKNFCKLFIAFN